MTSSDCNPALGSASGARQVERLTVPSPGSDSACQSIPLSGAHYFDKDISKATVKIKVLHNPQHPPLTSEILLHVSFYCYFTKALTERQGSQKKKKNLLLLVKGRMIASANCDNLFPRATGGTEIFWVSLFLNSPRNWKIPSRVCGGQNMPLQRSKNGWDVPPVFLPHSSCVFLLSAFSGLAGMQAYSQKINGDELHTFCELSVEGMPTAGVYCRMSLCPPLSYQVGALFYLLRRHRRHISSGERGRISAFGVCSGFPNSASSSSGVLSFHAWFPVMLRM